jgi:DNA topoisomerase VI subunit B
LTKLQRTTFEGSRAGERTARGLRRVVAKTKLGTGYFNKAELARMTGQPPDAFASVVLKELLDNALDACEMAGVAPGIVVVTRRDEGDDTLTVTVEDNAGGIPPETVDGMLDFDVRVSDKSSYRSPTRGQMGNAWKTILGIPYALGGKAPITVTARGVKHTMRASLDPAGDVVIAYDREEAAPTTGTAVSVTLPERGQFFEPELWVRGAALYNPHASVGLRHHGHPSTDPAEMYNPTTPKDPSRFKKVKPNAPTSPHWYDVAALEQNVFAHIKDAREGTGKDLPIGEYIGTFAGLKRTQLQAEVRRHLSIHPVRNLSDFEEMGEEERRVAVRALLDAMQRKTEPPKHDALGKLGKAHLKARFEEMYGIVDPASFRYQMTQGYQCGLPWRFEVAIAKVARPAQLFAGVNYSPTFGDPLGGKLLKTPEGYAYGLEGLLTDLHVIPWESVWAPYGPADEQPHTAVAVHLISPVVSYQDLGKSRVDTRGMLPLPGQKTIEAALWDAAKPLYKEEKRRRKQASRPARGAEPSGEKQPDLKEASFRVMEDAVRHVSGDGTLPYGARRLF